MRSTYPVRMFSMALLLSFVALMLTGVRISVAADDIVSGSFVGPAVDRGTVIYSKQGGFHVLTLSDDFSIHPEPPDPHWQVIDSQGNVFLLRKLMVKDDKINMSITLPSYIRDVAKVQMWCAFAEVVLGEAKFAKPIRLKHRAS